jgi:hypothetical protein
MFVSPDILYAVNYVPPLREDCTSQSAYKVPQPSRNCNKHMENKNKVLNIYCTGIFFHCGEIMFSKSFKHTNYTKFAV